MHTRAVDLRRINTKLLECYIVCKQLLRRLFLPRDAIRQRGISVCVCKDHKTLYKVYLHYFTGGGAPAILELIFAKYCQRV